MITKDEYTGARTQAALNDIQKIIRLIEDGLKYHKLITEIKSNSISTPWYLILPHVEKHVQKFGWKLTVQDVFKIEGQWDRYQVMYKVFTLS